MIRLTVDSVLEYAEDERISVGAKGILFIMAVKKRDGKAVNVRDLVSIGPDGTTRMNNLIRELKGFGLVETFSGFDAIEE